MMQQPSAVRPSEAAVVERLPELRSISGPMQTEVARVFADDVPEYFWVARASESHHPPDERGLGGVWLHTKRVYTAYRMLEPTYRAMSAVDAYEANCARAAVLLHDAFKYGRIHDGIESAEQSTGSTTGDQRSTENSDNPNQDNHAYAHGFLEHLPQYTDTSHDVKMATHIRDETSLPEEVARCVAAHGGSPDWYSHDGPRPSDDLEMLVHTADVLASNDGHRLPVWEPTPELLAMTDKDLPTIDWGESEQ